MSNALLNLAMPLTMSPADKVMLIVLADAARDPDAADRPAQTWLSIPQLAARTCLSERAVYRSVMALASAGHISRDVRPGVGVMYTVHPCQPVTPDSVAPLPESHPRHVITPDSVALTPDTESPNPLVTSKTLQKASPSSGARGRKPPTRSIALPDNFEPVLTEDARDLVARWPVGRLDRELAQWKDHHRAKGTVAKDWQASLRTWLRRAEQYQPTVGAQSAGGGGPKGSVDDQIAAALKLADWYESIDQHDNAAEQRKKANDLRRSRSRDSLQRANGLTTDDLPGNPLVRAVMRREADRAHAQVDDDAGPFA